MRIADYSVTKAVLERHGFTFKKSFGQNFLTDTNILQKIVDTAEINKNANVIEIGPGIGALTEFLAENASEVMAFEIDDRLPEVLENEIGYDHLKIVLKDILKVDINEEIKKYRKPDQKVVFASNLPYYITTPILFKLFEATEPIERITVMMQKEVADRFLASQNDKEYNALSVITQYRCDIKRVMDVSRHVFWPSPNVDSAVLQFTFHHKYNLKDEELFFKMVKACFVQRRKTIYNNFQTLFKDKEEALQLLEKAQLKSSIRAQQCTLEDFIRLYEVSYENLCTGKS